MPAPGLTRPRERITALAAVALVQAGLIVVLVSGFRVSVAQTRDSVERLIAITLAPPPPLQLPPPARHQRQAAPKALPAPSGSSPHPRAAPVAAKLAPVVPVRPSAPAAASARGSGSGTTPGNGAGGGTGGIGDGGTDLQQIAGEITVRDYPRALREAGVGGHVSFTFTVEPSGRVGRCTVTRSSGVPELDALTCRLVQQRFVYRPSTDRFGRPIEDEVDGDYDWIAYNR